MAKKIVRKSASIDKYSVSLDTIDFNMPSFQSYLIKNGITAKHSKNSRMGMFKVEVYTYTGTSEALKKMIIKFWQDAGLYAKIKKSR